MRHEAISLGIEKTGHTVTIIYVSNGRYSITTQITIVLITFPLILIVYITAYICIFHCGALKIYIMTYLDLKLYNPYVFYIIIKETAFFV